MPAVSNPVRAPLVNRSGKYLTDRKGFNQFRRAVFNMAAKNIQEGNSPLTGMAEMVAQLGIRATVAAEDPAAIQKRIVEGILSKESVDEVLAAGAAGLPSGRDIADEPLSIEGVSWNVSDFGNKEGTIPFYAVVSAVHADTDERMDFSCGSTTGIAQLFKLDQLGQWPVKARIQLGRKTADGNQPYWLSA